MKKDTYYFSHDATAKDDPKCMLLIDQLGLEGYGIFWVLVETLRAQPDYKCPMNIVPSMAKRYGTSKEKVETVISSFGLFIVEDECLFFSASLLRRMSSSDNIRKRLSDFGKKGAEIRYGQKTLPIPQEEPLNVPKKFIAPTMEQIKAYCSERNNSVSPEKFLDHYTSNGWKVGRNPMKDWRAAVRTWERSDFAKKSQHQLSATPNYNEQP